MPSVRPGGWRVSVAPLMKAGRRAGSSSIQQRHKGGSQNELCYHFPTGLPWPQSAFEFRVTPLRVGRRGTIAAYQVVYNIYYSHRLIVENFLHIKQMGGMDFKRLGRLYTSPLSAFRNVQFLPQQAGVQKRD